MVNVHERTKFTIDVDMPLYAVNAFCSMLKRMEHDGEIGHSEEVGIFVDGDGVFSPKFDIHTEFRDVKEHKNGYDGGIEQRVWSTFF